MADKNFTRSDVSDQEKIHNFHALHKTAKIILLFILFKLWNWFPVCSCDADRINTWNGTEVNKCIRFRNQFFANPCFGKSNKIKTNQWSPDQNSVQYQILTVNYGAKVYFDKLAVGYFSNEIFSDLKIIMTLYSDFYDLSLVYNNWNFCGLRWRFFACKRYATMKTGK